MEVKQTGYYSLDYFLLWAIQQCKIKSYLDDILEHDWENKVTYTMQC
jgi:hypothetical protein